MMGPLGPLGWAPDRQGTLGPLGWAPGPSMGRKVLRWRLEQWAVQTLRVTGKKALIGLGCLGREGRGGGKEGKPRGHRIPKFDWPLKTQ